MKIWNNGWQSACTAFALTAGVGLVAALGSAGLGQGPRNAELQTVQGKVQSFTTAPSGEVDGLLLDDGTVIHWPPHLQARFKDIAARGDAVRVTGWKETGPEGDEHFEVQSIVNVRTKVAADRGEAGPPPPAPRAARQPARGGDLETRRGTVQRFTSAPMGEIDGLTLDDGTWVHWPPHLQGRFKDIAAKGDRVEATGRMETGPAGDEHFEVQNLVNVKNAPASRDANGDREQRLRDLENRLEQLRLEIQRLRRDR
jgi:hypothetical protein